MKLSGIFVCVLGLLCLVEPALGRSRGYAAARASGLKKARRRLHMTDDDDSKSKSKEDDATDDAADDAAAATDDSSGGGLGLCFSELATVDVLNKGPVAMKDLQIGDYVKASSSSDSYEPVYAFAHWHPTKQAEFFQLYTSAQKAPLEITGDHLVFLKNHANPVAASSVQVGDVLETTNAGEITKIQKVTRHGIYAPLTPSGTIVVDGIMASNYVTLQANAKEYVELQGGYQVVSFHQYIHMGMSPFRLLCQGVSSNLCTTYNDNGIPAYPAFSIWINQWASQQNAVVHVLVLMAAFVLTGACLAVENVFGATMAPTIVALMAVTFIWMKKKGIQIRKNKTV